MLVDLNLTCGIERKMSLSTFTPRHPRHSGFNPDLYVWACRPSAGPLACLRGAVVPVGFTNTLVHLLRPVRFWVAFLACAR
jgi:hypothetical protein